MKKTHLLLLVLTAVLALSSAYSLAAINQVYIVDFEWYSQLNGRYENIVRDVSRDKCLLPPGRLDLGLSIIDGSESLNTAKKQYSAVSKHITDMGTKDNIYIYCTLGVVNSPEYRIKVAGIAQRGNNMEIKVSINTPGKAETDTKAANESYKPEDMVKISKSAFPTKGKIFVVFKNQDGRELKRIYCQVR